MSIPLRLYATTTSDSKITGATDCTVTSGSPSTAVATSKIGTETGNFRLFPGGNTIIERADSIGVPDGHGFILPVATLSLAGCVLISTSTWTPQIVLRTSSGSITGDIIFAPYFYNTAAATYAAFGTGNFSLTGQNITTTPTTFSVSPQIPGGFGYYVGNSWTIYYEIWINATSNSGDANRTIGLTLSNSSSVGSDSSTYLDTAGWLTIQQYFEQYYKVYGTYGNCTWGGHIVYL